MALEEYKRKRKFQETPEPPGVIAKKPGHRFVVQKHRATRLHYDFRLEMEGVLKSWAVPKGPSLDPADKRLAMMVEDHPVSYFDFEGVIPEGNYGAGTVMVWDVGKWEPIPQPGQDPKANPDKLAAAMIAKGDLKFQLRGQKLNGEFVLAHMKSRRPGTKGTEWLLIKKRDDAVVEGYDIDQFDYSVLSKRTLDQIAGRHEREWKSSRPASTSGVSTKNAWLADAIAIADKKKRLAAKKAKPKDATSDSPPARASSGKKSAKGAARKTRTAKADKTSDDDHLAGIRGARETSMPRSIHPMLATLIDEPFDDPEWLFEIKWDGYRSVAFIQDGSVRLVSRNQNDMTAQFSELQGLPKYVQAESAIVDGEIVALDDAGRPSFSLMQQRTGMSHSGRRTAKRDGVPIVYFAFDLLYFNGYDLHMVDLEQRKQVLQDVIESGGLVRYSDHYLEQGIDLYKAARDQGLEGIVAKRRRSCYIEKRTREWLKIKITQQQECVVGGYTDPRGSREHFGSLVLGLYDKNGHLVHVGQAGSGFTHKTHAEMWETLKKLATSKNPFYGKVEALRQTHWVKPELVVEVKFTEWTHETEGGGLKMRAPVYLGIRQDKDPKECVFELPESAPA